MMRKRIKSAFACYTRVGHTIDIFPPSRIKFNPEKTIDQILSQYYGNVEYLGIRYGTFQEAIDVNDNVLEKYPKLSRSSQPKKHLQQDFTLLPMNKENKDIKWIYSEVKCQDDNIIIPKFLIPIKPDQMEKETIKELLTRASIELDMDNTPISFSANGVEFSGETKVSEVYKVAREENQIVYTCTLGEEALRTINTRNHILEEIKSSEEEYNKQLETIISFWSVELKRRKVFSDFEFKIMMSDIPSIQSCHRPFLDELSGIELGYQAQFSGLFVAYASLFAIAINYVANYPQISQIVTEKIEHSNSAKKELNSLAEKCDGIDLLSYLIVPVKRISQYLAFIDNLRNNTPLSHPDSILMEEARSSIMKILRDIKVKSASNEQRWLLKQMEENLLNNFKLYDPNRVFVNKTDVIVKGHSQNKGNLFVFNDIIILTKNQEKGITVLFDCPAEQFHYTEVRNNPLGITVAAVLAQYNKSVINPRKEYTIIFKDAESMKTFFKAVIVNQMDITKSRSENLCMNWKLMNTRDLPPACGNAAAANGKEFIFFGGEIKEKKGYSSHLSAINIFTNDLTEIKTVIKGRSGHTITLIGSKLFIVGGRNQKKFFSKILSYDLKENVWSQQLPNNSEVFEARYGHTTTLCNNKLIIFGGKTSDGKILNDVTIFDPCDNMFCKVTGIKNTPQPRYHHTAVAYNNNLIIHGGKTSGKKLLSDIWELDFIKNEWIERCPRGEKPQPRKCHGQFINGNTTIIIGGVTTNGESAKTIAINLKTNISRKVLESGNVPNALRKFAYFVDRLGRPFIYGGMERKSKNPCHNFYMIEPNAVLEKEMSKSDEIETENTTTKFQTQKGKRTTIQPEMGQAIKNLFSGNTEKQTTHDI